MNTNELIIDIKTNEKTVVEKTLTEQEIVDFHKSKTEIDNNKRKLEISARLNELSQDLIQAQAGAVFEDLDERKAEFQTLHNELRILTGKPARQYEEVVS